MNSFDLVNFLQDHFIYLEVKKLHVNLFILQITPVMVGGNHEQKKKYLGKLTEEYLPAVSL